MIRIKTFKLRKDDVLVTKDGTIGKVAFVNRCPKKTTLNSGVFVIRPVHKSYYPKYFYYVLMSEHFKEFLGNLQLAQQYLTFIRKTLFIMSFHSPQPSPNKKP